MIRGFLPKYVFLDVLGIKNFTNIHKIKKVEEALPNKETIKLKIPKRGARAIAIWV